MNAKGPYLNKALKSWQDTVQHIRRKLLLKRAIIRAKWSLEGRIFSERIIRRCIRQLSKQPIVVLVRLKIKEYECSSDDVDEGIASSSSTPSSSPVHVPDTTIKSSKSVPELLAESTGLPTQTFIKRSIKLNQLSRRPLRLPLDPSDGETSSSRTPSPPPKDCSPNLSDSSSSDSQNSASFTEKPSNFFVQGANLKTVSSDEQSSEESPKFQNSDLETAQNITPTELSSLNSPQSTKIPSTMPNSKDSDASKDLLGILDDPKPKSLSKTAQNSSKSDKNHNEVSTSSKNSDPKKRHKSSKDRSDKSKKKRSHSKDKCSKLAEPTKRSKKSEVSSSLARNKRDYSPSGDSSASEDPSKRRRKSATSSSHSHSKEKSGDSEKRKFSDSKTDSDKKPTQIGNFKKRRVSRVSSDSTHLELSPISEDSQHHLTKSKRKSKDHQNNLTDPSGDEDASTSSSSKPPGDDSTPNNGHPELPAASEPHDTQTAHKNSETTDNPRDDDGLDPEKELARIWFEAGLTKPSPQKKSSGDDFLKRRLRRDEKEKSKKQAFTEALKPAYKPRNLVPRPPRPLISAPPPPPPPTDVTEINASVSLDEQLFKGLEDEPVPLIPEVEKVFESQPKPKGIPLIGEGFGAGAELFQGSEPMDLDESEPFLQVHSPHSIETVILDERSRSPGALRIDEEASPSSAHELNAGNGLKISYKVPNAEGLEMVKTLEVSSSFEDGPPTRTRTPSVLEQIMERKLDREEAERSLEEVLSQPLDIKPSHSEVDQPQQLGLSAEDIRELSRRTLLQISSTTHVNSTVVPRIINPPVVGLGVQPVSAQSHLQDENRGKDQLYEHIIDLMRVFRYRKTLTEQNPDNLEMHYLLIAMCGFVRDSFEKLKARTGVRSDDMVKLVVEYAMTVNVEPSLSADEVIWALKNTRIAIVEPVPAPVLPVGVERNLKGSEKMERQDGGTSGITGTSGGGVVHQNDNMNRSSAREPPPAYSCAQVPGNSPHTVENVPQRQTMPSQHQTPQPNLPRPMPKFYEQSPMTQIYPQNIPQHIPRPQQIPKNSQVPQKPKKRASKSSTAPPPLPPQPYPQQPPLPRESNGPEFYQNPQMPNPQQVAIVQMQNIVHFNVQNGQQGSQGAPGLPGYHHQQLNPQLNPQQQQQQFMMQQQRQQHLLQNSPLNAPPQPPMMMNQMPVPPRLPPGYEICIAGECNHPNCQNKLQWSILQQKMRPMPNSMTPGLMPQTRDPRSRGTTKRPQTTVNPQQQQIYNPSMMPQMAATGLQLPGNPPQNIPQQELCLRERQQQQKTHERAAHYEAMQRAYQPGGYQQFSHPQSTHQQLPQFQNHGMKPSGHQQVQQSQRYPQPVPQPQNHVLKLPSHQQQVPQAQNYVQHVLNSVNRVQQSPSPVQNIQQSQGPVQNPQQHSSHLHMNIQQPQGIVQRQNPSPQASQTQSQFRHLLQSQNHVPNAQQHQNHLQAVQQPHGQAQQVQHSQNEGQGHYQQVQQPLTTPPQFSKFSSSNYLPANPQMPLLPPFPYPQIPQYPQNGLPTPAATSLAPTRPITSSQPQQLSRTLVNIPLQPQKSTISSSSSSSSSESGEVSQVTSAPAGHQTGVIMHSASLGNSPRVPATVVPTRSSDNEGIASFQQFCVDSRLTSRVEQRPQGMASPREATPPILSSHQLVETTRIESPKVVRSSLAPGGLQGHEALKMRASPIDSLRLPTSKTHENASSTVVPPESASPVSPGSCPLDLSTKSSGEPTNPKPPSSSKPVITSDINIILPKIETKSPSEVSETAVESPQGPVLSDIVEDIPLISLDSSDDEESPIFDDKNYKKNEENYQNVKSEVNPQNEISEKIPFKIAENQGEPGDNGFSLVDDEIECDVMAKEMGIHLESSSHQDREEVVLKIEGVTSIPMDVYDGIDDDFEERKRLEKVKVKEEWVEDIPEDVHEKKLNICVQCKKRVAIWICSFCKQTLFCPRCHESGSDHFKKCAPPPLPVVNIGDDDDD